MLAGEAGTPNETLALLLSARPDVVVCQPVIGSVPLGDVLPRLLTACAGAVVLYGRQPLDWRVDMLAAGASACLPEDGEAGALAAAIETVGRGRPWLPGDQMGTVVEEWRRLRRLAATGPVRLTPREAEVLAAMARGLSAKEIAARLGVALKTVENHKSRLSDKLGVRGHRQVVERAAERGWTAEADPRAGRRGA